MSAFGGAGRGSDHGLAELDGLGDPATLRRRAEQAAEALDPDRRSGAHQEGADASNSVWVTVDVAGNVVDVSISRRWPDRLAAGRLGDALLEAYSRAQEKRAAAAMRTRAPAAETDDAPAYDPDRPDIADDRWLGWVWQTLGEADLRLQRLASGGGADAPAERVVAGPGGHVRLQVSGTAVTGVLVDGLEVAERRPDVIAVDARAAFALARRGGSAPSDG
jgi:hypothetical protein